MHKCKYYTLVETKKGHIVGCSWTNDKILFQFGNICHVLNISDFTLLTNLIREFDVKSYLNDPTMCQNERIYLRTEVHDLYFVFTENEFYELKDLIWKGNFKFSCLDRVRTFLN